MFQKSLPFFRFDAHFLLNCQPSVDDIFAVRMEFKKEDKHFSNFPVTRAAGPCNKISVIKTAVGKVVLALVIQVGEATFSDPSHPVLNGRNRFDTPGQNNTQPSPA